MILIKCPNCGKRNSQEFRYGGEYNPRPKNPLEQSDAAFAEYVYMRDNRQGEHVEWWYHRAGCGLWFLARRDTQSNAVLDTYIWKAGGAEKPEPVEEEES